MRTSHPLCKRNFLISLLFPGSGLCLKESGSLDRHSQMAHRKKKAEKFVPTVVFNFQGCLELTDPPRLAFPALKELDQPNRC
jgi:hypothetical protein